jgi:hypothetical protein
MRLLPPTFNEGAAVLGHAHRSLHQVSDLTATKAKVYRL